MSQVYNVELITLHPATQSVSECNIIKTCIKYCEHHIDLCTAGVPSSRLGHCMWVSWWTKRNLGIFFSGYLPYPPGANFIPPFIHTHSFHSPLWWCVRRDRPASLLFTNLQYRVFNASHPLSRPYVVQKLRILLYS